MKTPHPEGICARGRCCTAARRAARAAEPSEETIHRRTVAELRLTFRRKGHEAGTEPFFHCPNESKSTQRYRAKLHALGLSAGVPDLIIAHPVVFEGTTYSGLALELKSARGVTAAAQIRWLGYWSTCGFYAAVTRGFDETGDLLQACGLIDAVQRERFRA